MQAIDIVNPPARDALEDWFRWLDAQESKLRTLPISGGQKIEVKYIDTSKLANAQRQVCAAFGHCPLNPSKCICKGV